MPDDTRERAGEPSPSPLTRRLMRQWVSLDNPYHYLVQRNGEGIRGLADYDTHWYGLSI